MKTLKETVGKPIVLVTFYPEFELYSVAKGVFGYGVSWENEVTQKLNENNQKYLWFKRTDMVENGGTGHYPGTEIVATAEINKETWVWI